MRIKILFYCFLFVLFCTLTLPLQGYASSGHDGDIYTFTSWQLLHPVRPYGKNVGKIRGCQHFHVPGRYCPICKLFIGISEAPPVLKDFKPHVVSNGSIRTRGELYRHLDPYDNSKPKEGFDENRIGNRLHFNITGAISERAIGYLEGQWKYFWGQDEEESPSNLNLYQGFIIYNRIGGLPFDMTIGRQELVYGSAYILGANAFGNGDTFDVAKLDYSSGSFFRADFFIGKLTENKGDENRVDQDLIGVYATLAPFKELMVDFYWLMSRDEKDRFDKKFSSDTDGIPQTKHMFGTRVLLKPFNILTLELEPLMEFGHSYNNTRGKFDQISSYGGHVDFSLNLPGSMHLTLLASYSYASGDVDSGDDRLREFQGTTFTDSYIFGEMRIVPNAAGVTLRENRFSGMKVATGGLSVSPSKILNINVDFHNFTAQRASAGISHRIGNELNLIFSFKLPADFNVYLSANQFFPDEGYKQSFDSSKVVHYYYVQTQLSF